MIWKMTCRNLFILVAMLVSQTKEVQLPDDRPPSKTISKTSEFNVCLKPERPTNDLAGCFGQQMLRKLQTLEETEEFTLSDGISLKRDEAGPRDISNYLDKDPMDYRTIVESASTLIGRRAMQWDMSTLYPGLTMRIGPTLSNGVLEFVMDPRVRDRDIEHDPSTARLLTRTFVVPFLLGFKFQLSTLLPLIFGILILLSKKALILSKIAIAASSIFGFNSLTSSAYGGGGYYGSPGLTAYGNRYHGNDYFLRKGSHQGHVHPVEEDPVDPYYAQSNRYTNKESSDQINTPEDLRDRLEKLFVAKHGHERSHRTYSWND